MGDVTLSPSFSMGVPTVLFEAPIVGGNNSDAHQWQVAPDGKRFLMLTQVSNAGEPIKRGVDWFEELKQRLSSK